MKSLGYALTAIFVIVAVALLAAGREFLSLAMLSTLGAGVGFGEMVLARHDVVRVRARKDGR